MDVFSNNIMWDADIWGPKFWFFINTLAITYPLNPHETTKKKYYEFIQNLPLFIPNNEHGDNFSKHLDKYPVSPYLDSRQSFLKWVHFIHNKINDDLGKDNITFDEFINNYSALYVVERDNKTKLYKWKHKIVYFCIILALIISMYIGYNIK